MLNVALYLADQNPHRDRTLGITRATLSITDAIAGRVALHEVVSASSVALPAGVAETTTRLPFRTDHGPGRLVGDAAHAAFASVPADVWFYPKGYAASPLRASAPTLALVHDTILVHYQQHYPQERSGAAYAYWTHQLRATLRRVDRVATVSETARQQILAYCDAEAIRPPVVDVIYAATPFVRHEPDVGPEPFVLHLASEAPHKRTRWLLEAWETLAASGRDLPPLTLLGRLDAETEELAERLPYVRRSGRVSDAELTALFRQAVAVVVPSEIEGFGLPVLESYASGTPVCVTTGTALEEVLRFGTDRGLFQLDDPTTLADALDDVTTMGVSEIRGVQDRLAEAFSPSALGDRVEAALRATASA